MTNEIIGSILQIIAFSLIPFIVYLILNKSAIGFLNYIGLKKSTSRANYLAILASLLFAAPLIILTLTTVEFREIMFDSESVTGKFRQMGFGMNSFCQMIIIALFKTSFSEEILFRGFIAKRLIGLLGFIKGNLLQAGIFGLIHTAIFLMITSNPLFLFLIFIIPSTGAYVSGYLNEKIAGGSIIPGWISHGFANILAYSIVGFLI